MQRLAIAIAVIIGVLYTPAFSDNSIATKINNGNKLIFDDATDSLFYVYGNSNGAVKYVYGAGGSWTEALAVTLRDYPAIAQDSTGKRWVAVHQSCVHTGDLAVQDAYYYGGDEWSAETLYTGHCDSIELGPPSIAGASSTTTGIVYVAFLRANKWWPHAKSIILTKYTGTTAVVCTVATGSSLGDPAIAVEPYDANYVRVHITWEDNGNVKYATILDPMGSSSFGSVVLWQGNLSTATAHHPSIQTKRGLVVAAWAQGNPPDVYARQRATDALLWGDAVNQSGTQYASSDYPTIALGDAVVVAWEETNSASDHDILGHVDFVRDITIHNCDAISSYPHITLQRDGERLDEHLYLHTIWSEPDYAIGYNEIDLLAFGREGPQSASSGPMLTEPSLAACLPNPFRGRTQISYALPAACNICLGVYDATGRPVRTLASGHQTAGNYSVSWDARDADGKQVPCGVYFYRLDTPGFLSMKQAVVTR